MEERIAARLVREREAAAVKVVSKKKVKQGPRALGFSQLFQQVMY